MGRELTCLPRMENQYLNSVNCIIIKRSMIYLFQRKVNENILIFINVINYIGVRKSNINYSVVCTSQDRNHYLIFS